MAFVREKPAERRLSEDRVLEENLHDKFCMTSRGIFVIIIFKISDGKYSCFLS